MTNDQFEQAARIQGELGCIEDQIHAETEILRGGPSHSIIPLEIRKRHQQERVDWLRARKIELEKRFAAL